MSNTSNGTPPCKPQACAIQNCLLASGYDESKCTKMIDELYSCCSKFYKANGDEARSPCCPIPRNLKLKISQRQKEKIDASLSH